MPETSLPTTTEPTVKKRFGVFDILIFLGIAAVIVVLLVTIFSKLSLKHEVSSARVIADRTISDISKQNGADARTLGDKKFQASNSAAKLKAVFTSASAFAKGTPTIVRQTVANTKQAQNVIFIYKYGSKTPYYFRITTSKPAGSGTWQLVGIGGNSSEAALLK